jgi:parallel beta-helix repeat protein
MTFQSGDLILNDRYRIKAQIGEGAYGTVYRAVHVDLGVPRAIKVLRHDAPGVGTADFDAYRRRFQLEFQVAARLDHPNVIKVHDFVEENGVLYAVLEYAPNGSLADVLKERGPLPPLDAVHLLLDAARGLDALHAREIVHRDVKPSNILVDARGRAKIGDLGLAQVRGSDLSQRSMLGSVAGVHPGTSYYRSPEHEGYAPLMPTSDVYSLGCVGFELLTGKVWRWAQRKTERVRDLRPDAPRWLDVCVARMLHDTPGLRASDMDNPTKRYVDMQGVITALEQGLLRPVEIYLTPDQESDYPTLTAAVAAIAPGGIIHLAPGEYVLTQPLTVNKSVRLEGAGRETTQITCAEEGHVLKITGSGSFEAEGLTFRHVGSNWANVMEARVAELTLRTCRLIGGIRDTKNRQGGTGLWLLENTWGLITKCRIEHNALHGIEVSDQAQPMLEDNVCRENQQAGIRYSGTASGTALRNECKGNGLSGIIITEKSQPALEDNVCCENQRAGIRYSGTASGTALRNECKGNGLSGIIIAEKSQPALEDNVCRENQHCGIVYYHSAGGTARGNECVGNLEYHGIGVGDQAQPMLEENVCRENQGNGIAYYHSAGGTARGNECVGNLGYHGIVVSDQAQPKLEDNVCRENQQAGIRYSGSGGGTALRNECKGNGLSGMIITEKSQPALEDNVCHENQQNGIAYFESAGGTARHNRCYSNQHNGIYVSASSHPRLIRNLCRANTRENIQDRRR